MKNKLLILAVSASLLLLSITSQSAILKSKPEKCPSVSSIIAMGIDVEPYGDEIWYARKTNRYDTNEEWSFLFPVIAKDSEDALTHARALLSTLSFDEGPSGRDDGSTAFCVYKIDGGPGIAMAFANEISPTKIIRLFNRAKYHKKG